MKPTITPNQISVDLDSRQPKLSKQSNKKEKLQSHLRNSSSSDRTISSSSFGLPIQRSRAPETNSNFASTNLIGEIDENFEGHPETVPPINSNQDELDVDAHGVYMDSRNLEPFKSSPADSLIRSPTSFSNSPAEPVDEEELLQLRSRCK